MFKSRPSDSRICILHITLSDFSCSSLCLWDSRLGNVHARGQVVPGNTRSHVYGGLRQSQHHELAWTWELFAVALVHYGKNDHIQAFHRIRLILQQKWEEWGPETRVSLWTFLGLSFHTWVLTGVPNSFLWSSATLCDNQALSDPLSFHL